MSNPYKMPQLSQLLITDLDPGAIPNGALLSIQRHRYRPLETETIHAIFLHYGTDQIALSSLSAAAQMATVLIGDREMTLCYFNDNRGHPWSLWDNTADRSFGAFVQVIYHLEEPVNFCDYDISGGH